MINSQPFAERNLPQWMLSVLSFIAGATVTAGLLYPINSTPDYARGHSAGYVVGLEDGKAKACEDSAAYHLGYQDGFKWRKYNASLTPQPRP